MIKLFFALLIVTAQLLDYERGFVVFTTGDAFRVAPAVQIVNGTPAARRYARVTFDDAGIVTKLELSDVPLPPQGDLSQAHRFAVALSPAAPNPELAPPKATQLCANTRAGRYVTVGITVQVPPETALTDSVYMSSDQSGWNAQAYRLDRIDPLHYGMQLKLLSGTQMHVLFDRGSMQSVEAGQNGIEDAPHLLCIGDEDAQAFRRIVYHWTDETPAANPPVPQALPTPYNPAPFPNLPTPAPRAR